MTERIYRWKRYWCPPEGTINLSDGGYLVDPETETGKIYNPHLVSFDKIAATPCLILLGEPGIGKSITLKSVFHDSNKTLFRDLGGYGSDSVFINDVFKNNRIKSWENGNYHLELFLDGLDEGLLTISVLSKLLLRELDKLPLERLDLRMTCRTAIWPPGLEEGLKQFWKKENVKVYEMAPLTRASVKEAVEQNIPEKVDEFFNEVQRIDATPFAISPITLEMLINIFFRDSKFPPTRAELYEKGLGILCEEPRSRTNHRSIEIAGGERLAIASRIAAILVFSNHFAIYKDVDRGDVPDACIAIDRLFVEYSLSRF